MARHTNSERDMISAAELREELKKALKEAADDIAWMQNSIDKSIRVIDDKADIALWAIGRIVAILEEQPQSNATRVADSKEIT